MRHLLKMRLYPWRKAVQPVYDEYKDTYGEIVKLVKASTDNFKASGKK